MTMSITSVIAEFSSFFTCSIAGLSAFFPKHREVSVVAEAPLLRGLTLPLTTPLPRAKGADQGYQSVVQSHWVIATRSEANGQHLFNYCALHSKEPLNLRTSLLMRLGVGRQFGNPIIELLRGSVILPSPFAALSLEIATILPVDGLHRGEVAG